MGETMLSGGFLYYPGTFGTFGTFELVVRVGKTVLSDFLYYPGTFGTFGTFDLVVTEKWNRALWFSILPWYLGLSGPPPLYLALSPHNG